MSWYPLRSKKPRFTHTDLTGSVVICAGGKNSPQRGSRINFDFLYVGIQESTCKKQETVPSLKHFLSEYPKTGINKISIPREWVSMLTCVIIFLQLRGFLLKATTTEGQIQLPGKWRMCVIFFHSRAQTKPCPKQKFALERNRNWDFLQHSGTNAKTLLLSIRTEQICLSRLSEYHFPG